MTFLDFYRSHDGRRVLLYQAVALAAGAIALSLGLGDGHLDLTITRWFFDDVRRVFPLTNDWVLKAVLHDAARAVSAVAALSLLGLTISSWLTRQLRVVRAHRAALLYTSIATIASAAIVGALKHFSSHACPWDLTIFGGAAVYHLLLEAHAAAPNIDGCFPAAHPLAGFAWLAVGFALYPTARRLAWLAWAGAFALGTLFGGVQIVRGAHFLSHVLWTAWIVWGVNVALLGSCLLWPFQRERETHATERAPPRRGPSSAWLGLPGR